EAWVFSGNKSFSPALYKKDSPKRDWFCRAHCRKHFISNLFFIIGVRLPEGGAFAALCGRESPGCRFDVQKDLMIEAAGVVCSCGLFCEISPASGQEAVLCL